MQNALTLTRTSIGKKALVALTGAVLFGFVIAHLLGNLQVFLGPEHLNEYAELLRSMPKLVWTVRALLFASLVVHVALTVDLALQNRSARAVPYRLVHDVSRQSPLLAYARKTMILSGPIVLAFLIFHLAHLTVGADVVPGHTFDREDVYANVIHGFRNPYVTFAYVFANVLLGFHLYHGGHSLLQSLGIRGPRIDRGLRGTALALAAFVSAGNVLIPMLILARVVGREL